MNDNKLFEIASKVNKPLSLAAMTVVALYLIYKTILGLEIFGPLTEGTTFALISSIADKLFYLALVALVLGVIAYVFVQFLHRPSISTSTQTMIDPRDPIFKKKVKYSQAQAKALLEAYRVIYENPAGPITTPSELVQVVTKADALIMSPLTGYTAFLDDVTKNEIYNIHNILEQFKYNPSQNAIRDLMNFKHEFYQLIEQANQALPVRQ